MAERKRVEGQATPSVLRWARETAGLDLALAAKRIGVGVSKLAAAEAGGEKLTFNQLRTAAARYRRPLAVFFLDDPPAETAPVPDFRRVPEAQGAPLSPEIRLELRRINRKRRVADRLAPPGDYDWSFVGALANQRNEDPTKIAEKVRVLAKFGPAVRESWKTHYDAFNWWRTRIEDTRTLVFLFRRVDVDEVRGFSIAQTPFPAIALNRADSPRARLFTLVHEFVHVLLGQSAMCDIITDDYHNDADRRRIEVFCNAIAAEVLAPQDEFLATEQVRQHARGLVWSDNELGSIANRFMVSLEVVLRRLLTFGLATQDEYQAYRDRSAAAAQASRGSQDKGGFAEKGHELAMRTQGLAYVQIVLGALDRDEVTAGDVADFLDMKLDHLDELERAVVIEQAKRMR